MLLHEITAVSPEIHNCCDCNECEPTNIPGTALGYSMGLIRGELTIQYDKLALSAVQAERRFPGTARARATYNYTMKNPNDTGPIRVNKNGKYTLWSLSYAWARTIKLVPTDSLSSK